MKKKASHIEANYRLGIGPIRCANCTMYRPPDACTAVESPIRAHDLCDYFKMKKNETRRRSTLK